jgi:hypothetical protein
MVKGRVKLAGIAASALALGVLAAPAQAQFGGILGGAVRGGANAAAAGDTSECPKGRRRSGGSRVLGGILGGAASGAAGSAGGVFNYVPVSTLTDQISTAIACKLDPMEQQQAADATFQATRSDGSGEAQVGDMAAWTSETRENVSGTSTITARDDNARGGLQCINVSDVIIVNGEETRADKRMCRRPPAARYAIAQA